jgi:nicotinamidase-related amidase
MAIQLKDLIDPATTAVLCMEMQRGIVGDLSSIPQLYEAVHGGKVPEHLAGLMHAARAAGAQVVYCNSLRRKDRKGSMVNAPMLARGVRNPTHCIIGMVIEGVGLGYNVVIARDCVAGLPASHAESILANTLPVLGAVVSSDEIKAAWQG